jgi:hypothetical protein
MAKTLESTIEKQFQEEKKIVTTWITGQLSCTLVIPKGFARDYGLDSTSHVIVEKQEEGLLIRKLEL